MRQSLLWRWLVIIIIIIIILGGVIIIIIWRPPIPDPPPCIVCGLNGLKFLGIAEIILGAIALGIVNKLRTTSTLR